MTEEQIVDYKELYLKERIARIQAEMIILQKNYAEAQADIERTTKELESYTKEKE